MKTEYEKYRSVAKDRLGRYRTQSLFWEYRKANLIEDYPPIFTIKDRQHTVDGVTYPSLKLIYMSYEHVPGYEYDFAMDVFGSWEHWIVLSEKSLLKTLIKEWRDELEIKLRAKGIRQLIQMASENDPKGLQASKFLSDRGWVQKDNKTRGRPSKEEIERERVQQANIRDNLSEDMERLGLKVVEGGK